MRKLLLCAVALLGMATANAQEKVTNYKPVAGDITAEFVVSGGLNNTAVGFRKGGIGQAAIRGRMFIDEDMAFRAGVFLATSSFSQDKTSNASTAVDLAFGVEKHFKGTKNLSPYVGGEAYLGFGASSSEKNNTTSSEPFKFGIGLRGVFGADYYFVENVYLGVEAGLGLQLNTEGEGDPKQQESKVTFGIAPLIAGLKLGFVF